MRVEEEIKLCSREPNARRLMQLGLFILDLLAKLEFCKRYGWEALRFSVHIRWSSASYSFWYNVFTYTNKKSITYVVIEACA